jgi:CheY-like chemotaxis protein
MKNHLALNSRLSTNLSSARVRPVNLIMTSAKARILIADDDEGVRGVMSAVLAASGYAIVEARDGEDALHKCLAGSFDLLLMDHNMPNMSGWEACAEIQRQKPAIKVLILSGSVYHPAPAGKHVRFLPKPFQNQELVSMVGELLQA